MSHDLKYDISIVAHPFTAVPLTTKESILPAEAENGVSPPRYTEEGSTGNARELSKCKEIVGSGRANRMTDEELIVLLRQPPKSTMVLRTRSNFQDFFRGIPNKRMRSLLMKAYADMADATERTAKIEKRMDILKDVVV